MDFQKKTEAGTPTGHMEKLLTGGNDSGVGVVLGDGASGLEGTDEGEGGRKVMAQRSFPLRPFAPITQNLFVHCGSFKHVCFIVD